ncbi:MAG: hypothetical protein ACRD3V_25400 [Vicinamibacteria bacterium]
MNEPPVLARPLPLRVLIDEAIRQMRRNFSALYPAIALPLALLAVPLTFIYLRRISALASFSSGDPALPNVLLAIGSMGLTLAALMAAHYAAWGASILATMDAASGRPIQMRKSWIWMLRPRVIWTFLLAMFCWLAASLFCLFPGIYVGFLLSFVGPVMAEEERFGFRALKRSAQLLHFNIRLSLGDNPIVKAFLLVFVAWLLATAVSMLVQMPFALAQQIFLIRQASAGEAPDPAALMEGMAWFQLPGTALGALANAAVYLYINLGIALLFLDVRRRREGADLDEVLQELERSVAEPRTP